MALGEAAGEADRRGVPAGACPPSVHDMGMGNTAKGLWTMERVERLGRYVLLQAEGVFPLGADTLDLSRFATVRRGFRVCDLGCGSGALSIRAALTWRSAKVTGIDYWGAAYGYGQAMCEKNAASEGVGSQCTFQHGDANRLDFPDESFDAVVSNYVYHNITGADKHELLLETLRVLKKGGVFALNDEMKPHMYGDMEEFAQELRDMGYTEVRLIDTAQEAFGSHRRAAMMMLGESRMLVGRK